MQSYYNMLGNPNNVSNNRGQAWDPREYSSMTPAPGVNGNPGLNPRYVPPAMRGGLDTIIETPIRPESSMSNTSSASFASQITDVDGGVSLNQLANGGGNNGGYIAGSNMHGTVGGRGGYGDLNGGGMNGGGMNGGYGGTNMYGTAGGRGGYGGLGQDVFGGINGPSGYVPPGANRGSGYGRQANGTIDKYASLAHDQASSLLTRTVFYADITTTQNQNFFNGGARPGFGPNATNSGFATQQAQSSSSSSSAHDSVNGTGKAFGFAELIRSGACDFPDDFDSGAPGSGRKHGRNPSALIPQRNQARTTAAALLQPANPLSVVVRGSEGNTKGNAAVFLAVNISDLPDWFARLPMGFVPALETFFEVMPVVEPCRYAVASTAGVIRIRGIPYNTLRTELNAFVGRNAQIVSQPAGSPYHAVHVIMERNTGKTMDAFVEFATVSEATYVCAQFRKRYMLGRHPKVGNREVAVELSSQEELMSELFPRAKNITWEGATPRVMENTQMYYKGVPGSGFSGFLQDEEFVMMVKHAETPHRSPFAQRCIVRVFESLISTLHKYPWFAHETVSVTERGRLFEATLAITRALIAMLRRTRPDQQPEQTLPTHSTLQELAVAALTCPGFSEQQKTALVLSMQQGGFGNMTTGRGMNMKFGGNTPVSQYWPFTVLARDPSAPDELVNYFVSLMREATTGNETLTLADIHALRASRGQGQHGPFGNVQFDYDKASTLAEVGKVELRTIETLLSRVLPRSRASSSNHS